MIVYCVIRCVLGWICVIGFQYKNRNDWENIWKIELIFWKWKILETCIGHRTQTCKSFLWNIGLSQNNLGLTQKNVLFPSNRGSLRKNSGLEVEIFSSLNTREYCRVEDIIFIIFFKHTCSCDGIHEAALRCCLPHCFICHCKLWSLRGGLRHNMHWKVPST